MSVGEPVRVLVTGSRTWPAGGLVWDVLSAYRRTMLVAGQPMVVVHGAARGVDTMADAWADEHGVERDPHRYFSRLGRAGGHVRNAHMVSLGAAVCLAFIQDRSSGASGCAALADRAGIRTWVWRDLCPRELNRPRRCSARCRHRWVLRHYRDAETGVPIF